MQEGERRATRTVSVLRRTEAYGQEVGDGTHTRIRGLDFDQPSDKEEAERLGSGSGTAPDWALLSLWPAPEQPSVVRIAWCESQGDPAAISPGGANWGLMQINRVHEARAARLGYSWGQMLNPGPNLHVAYDLWLDQGWAPWACQEVLE